jgi:hypothetical protein
MLKKLFTVFIMFFIAVTAISSIINFCQRLGFNVPNEQVRHIIFNKTTMPITEVNILSNRGQLNYELTIPPSKWMSFYSYSLGEDSPKVTIKLSEGQKLTDQNYVESGYVNFLVVCNPTKIEHVFSFFATMFPYFAARTVCS